MATEFVFRLYPPTGDVTRGDLKRIARRAFDRIDDLESRLSSWKPGSQVDQVNANAGVRPVKVSPEIFKAAAAAKHYFLETDGAFDVTVGPLLELWGFYSGAGVTPTAPAIEDALGSVGMGSVIIEEEAGTIFLEKPGMRLDFGGIGKGVALDAAAGVMRQFGIESGLLSAGDSTILALGPPPDSDHWTVNVRDPYNADTFIDSVDLADQALSTSGCYDVHLEVDGRGVCDVLDPRTGRPVTGLIAVSVRAPAATESDALSTAFMVMGREAIEAYCAEHGTVGTVVVPESDAGPEAIRVNLATKGPENE